MTKPIVHFAIEWDEFERLSKEAARHKLSHNALARVYLREAIAGYDRRHEALMGVTASMQADLSAIQEAVSKLCVFSAAAIASSAIPPGLANPMPPEVRDQAREHIKESIKQGRNIDQAFDDGKFNGA